MIKPDIIEVISEHVSLRKMGHSYKGLCPFHEEKTPSFVVNEDRQTFHCFGCGERGDVIDFAMKIHGLTFKDALKHLGISDGTVQIDPIVIKKRTERAIARTKEQNRKDESFNRELAIIDQIEGNEDMVKIMAKHEHWTTYGNCLHRRSELWDDYCNNTREG